ncbi:MAG: HK97 family phage prohead protease [Dehalococcoidales bacterium]|nr:HK97 family phage prohead protease [Dehalococcoidales bacterium]
METRAFTAEIRAAGEGEDKKVSGLGIVYDEWTELWPGYKERIKKGAVKMAAEVKSFFNHDPGKILATLDSNPALELKDTDKGLEYISPIPPTSYGKDLEINLERGNVRGSSFAFDIDRDRMSEDEDGIFYRDIEELTLYEVGPVTNPAYIQTTAALRSAKEALEAWKAEQKPDEPPAEPDEPEEPIARNLCERRQKLMESLL